MTNTKGSLNIKDYPFAFSIATLLFPEILLNNANFSMIIGLTVFGGMFGSLLTILNPGGKIIGMAYLLKDMPKIFGELRVNPLVNGMLNKNFRSAVFSSPSISYENDKLVGMGYFMIILGLALYRVTFGNYLEIFELDLQQSRLIIASIALSFVFVIFVFIGSITGLKISKFNSVSHLDRIKSVVLMNTAVEFTNLTTEGARWANYVTINQPSHGIIIKSMLQLEKKKIKTFSDFEEEYDLLSMKTELKQANQQYSEPQINHNTWKACMSIQEIASRYKIKISEALVWFDHTRYLQAGEFDNPISQLQSSIESRDWESAFLKTHRIRDRLEYFLNVEKIMKKQIE